MLMFSNTTYFEGQNKITNQRVAVEYDETKMTASDDTSSEVNTYLLAFIAAIGALALAAM
jgi:hypothetical protein